MLERFTGDARGVVTGARESALRLGHDWIGCERTKDASSTVSGLGFRGVFRVPPDGGSPIECAPVLRGWRCNSALPAAAPAAFATITAAWASPLISRFFASSRALRGSGSNAMARAKRPVRSA